MNPKIDVYLSKRDDWQEEIKLLRRILLDCQLTEELKWGKPVYTFRESNVAVIWGFKGHCALGFCKGALLEDARGILTKPGENSQAMRKIRFANLQEITELEPIIKAYISEAMEKEKAGLEVTFKKLSEFTIPEELRNTLEGNPGFKRAFESLTPGRQRGYILHFSAPKQSKTREARIEKCTPQILAGKGFNDRPASKQKRK